MPIENFTIADAIKIQQDQLNNWKKLLRPEPFKALKKWAMANNETVTSADQIRRGSDLYNFVGNYLYNKENNSIPTK